MSLKLDFSHIDFKTLPSLYSSFLTGIIGKKPIHNIANKNLRFTTKKKKITPSFFQQKYTTEYITFWNFPSRINCF